MDQLKFQATARRLFDLLPYVSDPTRLLFESLGLLEGDRAALLQYAPDGSSPTGQLQTRRVVAEYPSTSGEGLDYLAFRERFRACPEHRDDKGYEKDLFVDAHGTISIERTPTAKKVSILLAYSTSSQEMAEAHELLVVRDGPERTFFTSYHVWMAAVLLREFERAKLEALALRAREESERRQRYAAYATRKVLRDERWADLEERTRGADVGERLWMIAIWTAYQVRRAWARPETPAPLSGVVEFVEQHRSTSDPLCALAVEVIDFLQVNDSRQAAREKWPTRIGILESKLPAAAPIETDTEQQASQLVGLMLEHGWRLLRNACVGVSFTGASSAAEEEGGQREDRMRRELCRELLKLTCHRVRAVLLRTGRDAASNLPGLTVNRSVLRLYFALLLGGADSLLNLYLPQESNAANARTSPEMTRQLVLYLARYMLEVVRIIEDRSELDTTPWAVTEVEVLDALLYLVDRYAIVELQVDGRLPIREFLRRAMAAEIRLHLNSSRYRDHLTHVLDVFLLGHLLLNCECTHATEVAETLAGRLGGEPARRALLENWAVAALLHDIGYQLPGAKGAAGTTRDWADYFSLDGRTSKFAFDAGSTATEFLGKLKQVLDGRGIELPDPAWHERDHGLLSAFRLAQVLLHAIEAEHPRSDATVPLMQTDLLQKYKAALLAVAHHNLFSYRADLSSQPLTCLLRLCDELQEWGRRRINVERMVKHLYLGIDSDEGSALPSGTSLEGLDTNLELSLEAGRPLLTRIRLSNAKPHFTFSMRFRNPATANVDVLATVLSKAYNLQGLDLGRPAATSGMRWSLELRFPRPYEYGELTEYDVYTLFIDQPRPLPLLPSAVSLDDAPGGLCRVKPADGRREDCFAVVVGGDGISGRMQMDPAVYFDELRDFKAEVLRHQTGLGVWSRV